MPDARESGKWIKYSPEIRQWRKEKCRDDIDLIEVFRVESIDKSEKREKKCNEKEYK
jgi:hypothetical protein